MVCKSLFATWCVFAMLPRISPGHKEIQPHALLVQAISALLSNALNIKCLVCMLFPQLLSVDSPDES